MAGLPGDIPAPRRLSNALERTQRLASPIRPPRGSKGRHRRRCASPVPLVPATPHPPCPEGSANRCAPEGQRLCRSCRFLGRLSAPPWASSQLGMSPTTVHRLFGLHLALHGLSFLLAWLRKVMPQGSCVKGRPRCAHQQNDPRGLVCLQGQEGVLGASVLADRGRRPCV
jgi:hypothetical protein